MNSWDIQHLAGCQWNIRLHLSSWPPIFNR